LKDQTFKFVPISSFAVLAVFEWPVKLLVQPEIFVGSNRLGVPEFSLKETGFSVVYQ
jgi:hypothetical protein